MPRGQSPWSDVVDFINKKDIRTVFDVGANVGQTTMRLVEAFPAAQVYSFEPVLSTFAQLQSQTARFDRVRCFPIGFSDNASSHEIFLQFSKGWNSIVKNIDRGLGTTVIDLRVIDAFCAEHGIAHVNILKTDTEGHDLAVLRGASGLLSGGSVDAVYCEVGFDRRDIGHTYFCDVLEYLQTFAFQLVSLYDLDRLKFIDHETEPCYPWGNALFARNALVQAKYGNEYAQWLARVAGSPQRNAHGA